MHVAQKFEHLLDTYRHTGGHKWNGAQPHDATGGVVTRSYVTNLRKGRIENPGYEKLRAIAKAMCFPPEVWFEDDLSEGRSVGKAEQSRSVAGRLEHVFEVVRNPKSMEFYIYNKGLQVSCRAYR
jgi:transcriptional regulator with XRE-family HTH domain